MNDIPGQSVYSDVVRFASASLPAQQIGRETASDQAGTCFQQRREGTARLWGRGGIWFAK